MASVSLPVSETDTDIVALGETTESTRQLPSLLDKLKCPTKSDFCRKRKVQSLKPTAVKKHINQVLQTLQIPKVLLLTLE